MGRRLLENEREGCCLKQPRRGLPVELDGRAYRGDLDIRVDADGGWHYNQSLLTAKAMVCLFASMLAKDRQGRYWLVTPTEIGRIVVEDAPLLGVEAFVSGSGEDQRISIATNVDQCVELSRAAPLVLKTSPITDALTPYVEMEDGIEVRLIRAVYRTLLAHGTTRDIGGETVFGVWSDGVFFPLGGTFAGDA